ncbi:9278_t:CDS:2 [Scutellospora calospora]|uniref:9278_t:CDS:1 n=1 Tax=Scutellospora calospora TaxID=85575 RepID=A0ACA9KRM7_9GLOM|nr:9278_t:CDS:2 [Scutellospora calospora]
MTMSEYERVLASSDIKRYFNDSQVYRMLISDINNCRGSENYRHSTIKILANMILKIYQRKFVFDHSFDTTNLIKVLLKILDALIKDSYIDDLPKFNITNDKFDGLDNYILSIQERIRRFEEGRTSFNFYIPQYFPDLYEKLFNIDLTIIHTNDVHSRYDQINEAATDCSPEQFEQKKCYGGTARHKTVIDRLRKENKNSLLLDGGDQFQGTLFFTYYNAIGNHEFDKGPETLIAHHARLNMPIVCANINTTLNPLLGANIKPYHIFKEYNLAVIGYITDTTGGISNAGPTLKFYDPIPIVQHYVNKLRAMGIKRILTVSHNGYGPDKELAAKTYGVAVHIGGHSHTLLSNYTTSKDYPLALGPYPTTVKNAIGEDTLVVQAFWSGKYIGHLDVSFNNKGKVVEYSGAPILVDQSIPQDPEVVNLVKQWRKPFDEYAKTVIGSAADEFDQQSCQKSECTMGNLILDSFLWSIRKINKVNVAFMNAGGIRAGLLKGNITRENVLTILPFGNSMVILDMNSKNITDMLESVTGRSTNIISGKQVTSFIQVSGIRFIYDSSKPIFKRVLDVHIQNSDTEEFEPLDPNKSYKIITLDFVANTGDGLLPYIIQDLIPLDTSDVVLTNYIQDKKIIKPYLDGRIQDVSPVTKTHSIISPHEPIHFGYFDDDQILSKNVEIKMGSNKPDKQILFKIAGL